MTLNQKMIQVSRTLNVKSFFRNSSTHFALFSFKCMLKSDKYYLKFVILHDKKVINQFTWQFLPSW